MSGGGSAPALQEPTHAAEILAIAGLRKSFGRNEVLHGLDLRLRSGDLLGLMGANGAGKSTLIKILAGVESPSSGAITAFGDRVESLAGRSDVAFIHQDLGLVDELSIADNLSLGRRGSFFLDRAEETQRALRALATVNLVVSPTTAVGDLSPGQKALVAVARALDTGARLLFVDEATSTLPRPDAELVLNTLKAVAADGGSVVMVTHKLNEVLTATNRIVVLVDGVIAADEQTALVDRARLVAMLASHELQQRQEPSQVGSDDVVLQCEQAATATLRPVDLTLRRGDVVGVTGLPGSGLYELAFLVHGITRPTSGAVVVEPGVRRGLVPPHRETQGGFAGLNVRDNLALSALPRWRRRTGLLNVVALQNDCAALVARLNVTPTGLQNDYMALSGGNKQKVGFGRVLATDPDVLVLCEPTRGVDVQTRQAIYDLIRDLSEGGKAVLIISSDSEDLLAVCRRVAVVVDGAVGSFTDVDRLGVHELEEIL